MVKILKSGALLSFFLNTLQQLTRTGNYWLVERKIAGDLRKSRETEKMPYKGLDFALFSTSSLDRDNDGAH